MQSKSTTEKNPKPLKRHPALVPLSKDHHFGLLLCWKIRAGISKNVAPERIARYVKYFFNDHLENHFLEEEKHLFSLLDEKDEKRKKAESQHRKLRKLVEKLSAGDNLQVVLGRFEEDLDAHIRFEERDLFPYLQNQLDAPALERLQVKIEEIHETAQDTWMDEFWA